MAIAVIALLLMRFATFTASMYIENSSSDAVAAYAYDEVPLSFNVQLLASGNRNNAALDRARMDALDAYTQTSLVGVSLIADATRELFFLMLFCAGFLAMCASCHARRPQPTTGDAQAVEPLVVKSIPVAPPLT